MSELEDCGDPVNYFIKLLDPNTMETIRYETGFRLYGITGLNTFTLKVIYKMIGMLFIYDLYPFVDMEHAFGKRHSLYSSNFIDANYTIDEFRSIHNN